MLEPDDYAVAARGRRGRDTRRSRLRATASSRSCATRCTKIGIHAEVSGRLKHLYSIYKKVQRTGSHDLSTLYDILAFRIIVQHRRECYLALGHVHELWQPKDGRIKDFIASPKPNGYQSLHTTVFCLDDRLAEIQIRTREMHQMAEYGVAMHWYYKDIGDDAKAHGRPLQSWVQQVKDWQQELQAPGRTPTAARAGGRQGRGAARADLTSSRPLATRKSCPLARHRSTSPIRVHTDLGTMSLACASPRRTAAGASARSSCRWTTS